MLNQTKEKFIHFCVQNACYLVPYPETGARARLIKNSALFLYVLVLLFFQIYLYKASPQVLGFATNIAASDLYTLTNRDRVASHLLPLNRNFRLEEAAYKKAQDMFAKNYWAHYAPDGSTSPWQFILSAGYNYRYAGENLAKDFDTSSSVVAAWMASPSHRANLLSGNYRDFGIVAVNGTLSGEETTLVVQMFGSLLSSSLPSSKPPATKIAKTGPVPKTITGPGEVASGSASQPSGISAVGVTPIELVSRVLNPIASPKTVPLGFGFFLLSLFAFDEFATLKNGNLMQNLRRTEENLAHMAILALLMVVVFVTRAGGIL